MIYTIAVRPCVCGFPNHLKWKSGWPRFGSVRLRFVHGTVRAVPVFGSDGSSGERASPLIFQSLLFWISLLFSFARNSLLFWAFSSSFPGISGGRRREKSLRFWWFSLFFFYQPKKQGKEDQGRYLSSVSTERNGSGSAFGSWRTVPAVPVPLSVPTNPKNLLRLFFRNNLARQEITSKNKNNLARLFLCLF